MTTKNIAAARDAEQTKADILRVALDEFAMHGFTGARVDRIAEGTKTTKGMIYYYFKDKEGLYKAILESVYPKVRSEEEKVDLFELNTIESIEKIIDFTINYHESNKNFVRLVMIENINNAQYLHETGIDSTVSYSILKTIGIVLDRGRAAGIIKRDINPIDLHILYTSLSFYRVSNHATVSTVLGINMLSERTRERHTRMIKDAIIAYLTSAPIDSV